jgi:hypothetical protein
LTILRRSVDPRARAWRSPASTPAARSRLWAIAAHCTQAEFVPNRPDGMCAKRSVNQVCEHGFDYRVLAVGDVSRLDG